jgi:hypothetical protein
MCNCFILGSKPPGEAQIKRAVSPLGHVHKTVRELAAVLTETVFACEVVPGDRHRDIAAVEPGVDGFECAQRLLLDAYPALAFHRLRRP